MKKRTFTSLTAILVFLMFGISSFAGSNPYVRMPALNEDGSRVLFAYQGDIWIVNSDGGEAQRLTANKANDIKPLWSPDDKSIAFSSDRYGNYDVYTLPLDGQPLKRLTYHTENDVISSWQSDDIYFTSDRFFPQVEREQELMKIDEKGGTPHRFLDAVGFEPIPSPNDRFIAFVRGSCRTEREAYRGSANRDIWIYDKQEEEFNQITTFKGNDFNPKWRDDNTLLFISSRKGNYNIHEVKVDENGSLSADVTSITDFSDDGIREFSVSQNGEVIAFERKTSIYILEEERNPRKLEITMPMDQLNAEKGFKDFKKDASAYEVSPNGDYIAFIVHGNLFFKLNHKEANFSKALVKDAHRVKSFDWLSNNSLIYTADDHNQYDLYLIKPTDGDKLINSYKFESVRLTETEENESEPVVSPNNDKIAYIKGNGQLFTAEIKDEKITNSIQLLDGWAEPSQVSWSPDSKWLAYSKGDLNGNREIFIHKADGTKEPANVSMHPRLDSKPVWSHDKLAFISDRNNNDRDIWFVWLREKDWQRTRREWKKMALTDSSTIDSSDIQIDFENIHERITQVTGLPGNESDLQVAPDGKTFYFVTNRDDRRNFKAQNNLYQIRWDGKKQKPLLQNGKTPYNVKLGPENKHLYMLLKGGKLARVSPKKKKLEPQPFQASVEINYKKQKEQIFEEAWRVLENRFYDPDYHGRDWQKLKEQYKPRALSASTNQDFQHTFNLMLGQINASHMGLYRVKPGYETPDIKTGLLGIDISPVESGIKIKKILDNVPASREESQLQEGDIITSVDGQRVNSEQNFYEPLNNKAGQQVILNVLRNDNQKEIVIRPTQSIGKQLYEDWVDTRKNLTEEYSDGKLGYIHIRGMNWNSFERFERELAATAYDKEGLVIDVRYNGGGWTTDYLMTILDVRQHAYTVPRGATDDLQENHEKFREHYPFGERLPFYPWTKPSITLCNQNSYSNAEIFSHAYQNLDLGTLVGTPTFGAVISTGGQGLLGGAYVRIPYRAWYVKKTDKNMELNGAVPDIIEYNEPDSKAEGNDPQLKKAVEELLNQIDMPQE